MFKDISIRKKLIFVYLFCCVLPPLAGGVVWYNLTSQEIADKEEYILDTAIKNVEYGLHEIIESGINIATQISNDGLLMSDLSKNLNNVSDYYDFYVLNLRKRFDMYLYSTYNFSDIVFYTDKPLFQSSSYFRTLDDDTRNLNWYKAASETDAFILAVSGFQPSPTFGTNSLYVKIVRKIAPSRIRGSLENYLVIDLNVEKVFSDLVNSDIMDIYITDAEDKIVWTKGGSLSPYLRQPFTPPDSAQAHLKRKIVRNPLCIDGWSVIGIYDNSKLKNEQQTALRYILAVTLAFSFISMVMTSFIFNSVIRRITYLANHMQSSEGSIKPIEIKSPGKDEVGSLILTFNKMIEEIYVLQMQKKDKEMSNLQAELKYLQSQVDPHFLLNTLNAVLVFCVKKNYQELTSVVSSLSKLLKRLLVSGDEIIPLKQEFDFIEKYLDIEKFRFGDKFDYNIVISEDAGEFMIPKMAVQPLVENACIHGLQHLSGSRQLSLSGALIDGNLKIQVMDNGIGMSQSSVDSIKKSLNDVDFKDDFRMGIGLTNVYRRLKLYYGDDATLDIKSNEGEGTVIVLAINTVSDLSKI